MTALSSARSTRATLPRRARSARNRLLENLRRGIRRRAVILILLESLVSAASIDGEWNRGRDGDALETDGDSGECEVDT